MNCEHKMNDESGLNFAGYYGILMWKSERNGNREGKELLQEGCRLW